MDRFEIYIKNEVTRNEDLQFRIKYRYQILQTTNVISVQHNLV